MLLLELLLLNLNNYIEFWHNLGINIIPSDSKNKKPLVNWKEWQNKSIPKDTYENWKKDNLFDKGCSLITGKILYGLYKGKYLVVIDIDNKKGIEEFLFYFPESKTLEKLAVHTIVEQHEDAKDEKVHIYFITDKQIEKRSKLNINNSVPHDKIPEIEVKSDSTTLVTCTPSIHTNGFPYTIIGTHQPKMLDESNSDHLEKILKEIFEKFLDNEKQCNQHLSDILRELAKTLKIDNARYG